MNILKTGVIDPVNRALDHAKRLYNVDMQLNIGRSDRCNYESSRRNRPDWVLINGQGSEETGKFFVCWQGIPSSRSIGCQTWRRVIRVGGRRCSRSSCMLPSWAVDMAS